MSGEARRLRAVIVDDERLARENVRLALEGADLEVVAECRTGSEAVKAIRERTPDLVFLDIRLPDEDGFQVIRRVGVDAMPAVVFVTAYDEFATRAFDVHAVDYVVKPFPDDRLRQAVARARQRIERGTVDALRRQLEELLEEMSGSAPTPGSSDGKRRSTYARRLLVRHQERQWFVSVESVDWFEARGNYVRLHAGGDVHLVRSSLAALDERLDPACFIRIHRGAIVNVDRIAEIQPWFSGRCVVALRDGTKLMVSRTYRTNLLRFSL